MRLLYSWQASLSAQTPCTEKTVDTHKIQFPLHHTEAHRNFLGSNVKFSWAISHSTQRGVMRFCSRSTRAALVILKAQNAKNSKMGQSVLCRTTISLLICFIFIANGRHAYCLTQTSLCIQSSGRARCCILYQNIICILPQKIGSASPPKHMKRDCAEGLFKGKRLTFSCLHCKLQINFLCLCWTRRPSVVPEAMHLGFIFLDHVE